MQEDEHLEQAMADALNQAMEPGEAPASGTQAAAAARSNGSELSLVDQLSRLETASSQIKDRLREERLALTHAVETRRTQIRITYERELEKLIGALERRRDDALEALEEEAHEKLAEYDRLMRRLPG